MRRTDGDRDAYLAHIHASEPMRDHHTQEVPLPPRRIRQLGELFLGHRPIAFIHEELGPPRSRPPARRSDEQHRRPRIIGTHLPEQVSRINGFRGQLDRHGLFITSSVSGGVVAGSGVYERPRVPWPGPVISSLSSTDWGKARHLGVCRNRVVFVGVMTIKGDQEVG